MDDQPLFGESKQSTSIIQWSIATVIALWVVVCWCCSNTCPIVVAIRARSYNRSLFARGARSQYCVIIAIVYGLKGHWEHFVIAGLLLLTVAQLGMAVRRARVARSARCVWDRSHQSPNSRAPLLLGVIATRNGTYTTHPPTHDCHRHHYHRVVLVPQGRYARGGQVLVAVHHLDHRDLCDRRHAQRLRLGRCRCRIVEQRLEHPAR